MSMFCNLSAIPACWYPANETQTVQDLQKAWEDGKDFKMIGVPNEQYFSIRDAATLYKDGVLSIYLYPDRITRNVQYHIPLGVKDL